MALFPGAVPAGGGDPPGQQEPIRVDPGTSPAHRQPHQGLPHAARAGRSGAFRPGNLQRRGGLRTHRRGFARRQGPRAGLHEFDDPQAPALRQARQRAHHDPPLGGHRHGLFRRLHPPQRPQIHHFAGVLGRGDPLGIRQFDGARQVAAGAEGLHPDRPHAAGRTFVVEVGRFALPALRRHLFHLHDPLRGQRGSDAPAAAQGRQECLRLGLFRHVEGLPLLVAKPDLGGKNGRHHPGGMRHRAGRPLLPDLLGRGTIDQLLSHRRRGPCRRRLQHRHGAGQTGRRRRPHAAFLAPLSAEGTPDLDPRTGAARHTERSAGAKPQARRVPHVDRRRGEPAQAGHRTDRRPAQRTVRLLGMGSRQRTHLRQPVRPGTQSHHVQQYTEVQHLPARGHHRRYPEAGGRGDALPRRGRIRRQYGRTGRRTTDIQPAPDPPDHRQPGQPPDRLEQGGRFRRAGIRPERARDRHDGRHRRHHLHQEQHVRLALDRKDRRRTARIQQPDAG